MPLDASTTLQTLSFAGPDGVGPRGTVIVIPGRGESPAVYARFGARLAADAYPVTVIADPVADEPSARTQIAALVSGEDRVGPVVLVGSDTGALFAAGLIAAGELDGIDGLIAAGLPSPQADAPAAGSWDAELDARTTCPTHRGRISDPSLVRPGALYEPLPAGWSERADLAHVDVPILALHGQDDPISSLDWARDAYAAAPRAELVSIAGAPHDVLNDKTHRTTAAVTVLWLERLRGGDALQALATLEPAGVDVA